MRLVIKCAVCNKPVDKWSYFQDRITDILEVKVECHGQEQTEFYTSSMLESLHRQYRSDATIHGVAFEQKGISNV